MSIKWIKITTTMFDDEKIKLIRNLPESDSILLTWIQLLVQAGKANASGSIILNERIPYSEEMLATIFDRPLNIIRLALNTFEQFGMINIENGVITISNWEKHQNVDGMEKIRELNRQRVANHRQKKKLLAEGSNGTCNVTVTHGNALDIDKEIDIEKDKNKKITSGYTPEFESFWSVYPKKISKKEAVKKWSTRLKEKVEPETLIQAATNYAIECKKRGTSPEFIMHPSTFLGPNEKYADYISPPEPPTPQPPKKPDGDDFLTKYGFK
ncbi:phage replisome organizer N-terminal domain-containing protein [Brevibacillus sp. HD3.3A]|uniref:phage replisome organizer N-terminal domain-containing protein n=1 Tax=Brevibacillus sp. HD3.3A TaxID=2738979 RepID=UPI00156A98DD|nr:phage replisome organizer N-terminal domain-containing protein [Brevibacillus sp. HD3.3A]UED72115.1 phage replisome organizer N-terminal domain-containing protein [Brevibacillus sp. HD3.3A]